MSWNLETKLMNLLIAFIAFITLSSSDADSKYVGKCIAVGLLDMLCTTMRRNVYEVNTQAGYCLCCMVKDSSPEDAQTVLAQVTLVRYDR